MSVHRVAARVRHGGHSVPPDVIRRRYESGLRSFFELYLPIADSWEFHENTTRPPTLIAMQEKGRTIQFGKRKLWESIQTRMSVKDDEAEYAAGTEPRFAGIPISEVMDIFDQAAREAYARHKALGIPIVIWRDGKVVEVPPEEIKI